MKIGKKLKILSKKAKMVKSFAAKIYFISFASFWYCEKDAK
jgi:hypothetical protein